MSPSILDFSILEDKYIKEKYKVSSNDEGIMILSRVFWHGYKATLNGHPLDLSPQDGMLKVKIPANVKNGVIEITYFPSSWTYSLWIALLGIIFFFVTLFFTRKQKS